MRGTLIAALAVGFAALVFAGKPAAATPANAALAYGETNAGVVEQVGRKYRYSRRYRRGPYYRGYAYRPYYRSYGYYGYPYYYRRGPGVSFWFGF
jgi:hypothetical protein